MVNMFEYSGNVIQLRAISC